MITRRVDNDLVRYHRVGVPHGWLELEGQRIEISPDNACCTRDHSRGPRYGVGAEAPDQAPGIDPAQFPMNFLGAGLDFGFDGHHHGEWRGPLHIDGEYIADCGTPETARRVHQIRDCVVWIRDGEAEGVSNLQSVVGEWPGLGLNAESSFI